MNLINGKQIANKIIEDIKLKALGKTLAIILASNDQSSHLYVNLKKKRAEEIGIKVETFTFGESDSAEKIINKINELNSDSNINGVLIQLPFFDHLKEDTKTIVNSLDHTKDVDGLTAINQGMTSQFLEGSIPPAAVEAILESLSKCFAEDLTWQNLIKNNEQIESIKGKEILVVNNSDLVGKPLSMILSTLGGTVTIANTFTKDLENICMNADIIVAATGKTNLIDASMIKENAILIDVTSEKINGEIKGDFIVSEELENKASFLTPVPGGIGPITIACLLRNLVK
jgi:methylenetetrahydrofolate dehydrogenase (NADP+) / methenyltetrahydrofolate cyclohydrolase